MNNKCDHVCVVCGAHETGEWIEERKQYLEKKGLCFGCGHWNELYERYRGKHPAIIVKGIHYIVYPDKPKGYGGFLGFGGQRFHFRMNDGREIVTHNLWCQGDIPKIWQSKLPDNAMIQVPDEYSLSDEMANIEDLKSSGSNTLRIRLPPRAPIGNYEE